MFKEKAPQYIYIEFDFSEAQDNTFLLFLLSYFLRNSIW